MFTDHGNYIDAQGCCTACGNEVDVGDFAWDAFKPETGGVQPGTPDGAAVYWAEGTIPCEHCGARLFMQVSS